jgi:hypothetical protein
MRPESSIQNRCLENIAEDWPDDFVADPASCGIHPGADDSESRKPNRNSRWWDNTRFRCASHSSLVSGCCRDDHKMAGRPFYGGIPKVVGSQMVPKDAKRKRNSPKRGRLKEKGYRLGLGFSDLSLVCQCDSRKPRSGSHNSSLPVALSVNVLSSDAPSSWAVLSDPRWKSDGPLTIHLNLMQGNRLLPEPCDMPTFHYLSELSKIGRNSAGIWNI